MAPDNDGDDIDEAPERLLDEARERREGGEGEKENGVDE